MGIQYKAPPVNAPLLAEVLLHGDSPQEKLHPATEGVLRYVWESRFASMLIEIVDGVAYVNGDRVDSISSAAPNGPAATS